MVQVLVSAIKGVAQIMYIMYTREDLSSNKLPQDAQCVCKQVVCRRWLCIPGTAALEHLAALAENNMLAVHSMFMCRL